jgi:hypothetical protein
MNLGVGLGTGIAANIDTDEQKAMQPASTSSSSTATANDSSSSTSLRKQGRLHGSAQEIVFGDPQSPILDCIASFLVGSNSTDPAQMVTAFFKPAAIFQQNRRDDFFNFQRVNKAVYRSLRPMVQKIHKILFESDGEALSKLLLSMSKQGIYPATKIIIGNLEHINLDEPACRNLLMPMVQQGVRPAVKIIIGNLQRLNIPIGSIMDADGNNALHLASQRGDVGMRDLILAADQVLDRQRNRANQTPYQLCSRLARFKIHGREIFGLAEISATLLGISRAFAKLNKNPPMQDHPMLFLNDIATFMALAMLLLGLPLAAATYLLAPTNSESATRELGREEARITLKEAVAMLVIGVITSIYTHTF